MSEYSDALDSYAMMIDPSDDDYEEKLKEVAGSFRGFNEALSVFLAQHGFTGDSNNNEEQVNFLTDKFKEAEIAVPRYIDNWFDSADWKKRETAFKICFALNLNIDATNDFFRRVQFERSFDCHKIEEAVYYFCIKNNLKYCNAEKIIGKIKDSVNVEKIKNIPDRDILYTRTIINEISKIDDGDNLIAYITENIENFGYNNATVIEFIKNLWSNISGSNGLAKNEGEYIAQQRNVMPIDSETKEDKFLDDNYVVSDEEASSWTIYNQILGLDYAQEKKFSAKRSLASAFSENMLLPLKSSLSFPSSQMLNSILRGELGDNESYRKMLILLVFYSFWAKKTIENKTVDIKAGVKEAERCLYSINKFLVDAGYPTLYFGNPYDWIFMWALRTENPLVAFRSYMLEVLICADEKN